jgi:hypothetical protein
MTAEHEERLDEVKWWREDDEASAALAIAEHPTRYTEQFEPERPTREQVEELQRQAARQVHDEWVAAGRPGEKVTVQWRCHGVNEWQWTTDANGRATEYRRFAAEEIWQNAGVDHRIVPWMDVPPELRQHKPLTVRFELAPGFGLAWLSLLACCCELRGGIVDAKGCGLDDG